MLSFSLASQSPPIISDTHWQLMSRFPLLRGLDLVELTQLRQLAELFLHDRVITGANDMVLDDLQRVSIATQCCLPLLQLGIECLADWKEVVVYPGEFVSRSHTYESIGEYLGIVHESEEVLAGQARADGPLLLSWLDCADSPSLDGWNVPIHEIAHKLDMRTGEANGCPPLHADMSHQDWKAVFADAFADLQRQNDLDEFGPIDLYAAENPAECFAVLSEYFFELPHVLHDSYPQVYQQLSLFYRQDPKMRLADIKYRSTHPESLPPEYTKPQP